MVDGGVGGAEEGGAMGSVGGGRVEGGRTGGARERLRTCTVYILVPPSGRCFVFLPVFFFGSHHDICITNQFLYKFYIILSSLVPPLFEFNKCVQNTVLVYRVRYRF